MRLLPDAAEDGQETADVASARAICARYGIDHHLVDLSDSFSPGDRNFVPSTALRKRQTLHPCTRSSVRRCWSMCRHWALHGHGPLCEDGRARRPRLLRGLTLAGPVVLSLHASQSSWRISAFPWAGTSRRGSGTGARVIAPSALKARMCFLRGEAYAALVGRLAPGSIRPGPILTRSGVQLGMHKGLPLYTVGQRSGLGIAAPRPVYVLELDAARNALVVGHSDELLATALVADGMRYVSGVAPAGQVQVQAQIRYRARPAAATLFPLEGERALVRFDSPVRAVAPGQAVVLYHGDEVIGGGRIVHAQQQSHTEEQ